MPPPGTRDRSKADSNRTGSDGTDRVNAKGSDDNAVLRFAFRIWLCTIILVGIAVGAYFVVHQRADVFT